MSELATLLQGAVQERHAARRDVGNDAPVTLPRDADIAGCPLMTQQRLGLKFTYRLCSSRKQPRRDVTKSKHIGGANQFAAAAWRH